MNHWMIWLIIVILLVLMEASTDNLISIWFIGSGTISLFVSLFIDSFLVQFTIFILVGILLMICTKSLLEKMIQQKKEKEILEKLQNKEGVVTIPLKKNEVGEVSIEGENWPAISEKTIQEGKKVRICGIESSKLIVEKIKEDLPKKRKQGATPKKKTMPKKKKET